MRRFGGSLSSAMKSADFIALFGPLGAGKTTFARGVIQALCGPDQEVPSPTYTLVQTYDTRLGPLWHYDLYRLDNPDGVFELGWDDTVGGIALVEWPEKAGKHLPAWRLDVRLDIDGDTRRITLEPRGEDWQTRLNDFRF